MKRTTTPVLAISLLAITLALLPMSSVFGQGARQSFGFNGAVAKMDITGGGAYDAATASNAAAAVTFVHAGGSITCTVTVAGVCEAGEGVRWDAEQLLVSSGFKCVGTDTAGLATTDGDTVVIRADFYKAGDGNDASFTRKMIVSQSDLGAPASAGQNIWVEGFGCGIAVANFN